MGKQQTREELAAQIAAFQAKGGAIKQLQVGDTCGMRSSDWKAATRGEGPYAGIDSNGSDESERAAERRMEELREAYHVGGSAAVNEVLGG